MSLLESIINYANNLRASVLGREDGFYDVSGETTGLFHWPSFNENTSPSDTTILLLLPIMLLSGFVVFCVIVIYLPYILFYKIYEIFLKPVYINTTQRGGKKNVKNKH